MTGERNESSVLFSIQMLVKDAPAAEAPPPQKDESSSLIDLRTLMSSEAKKAGAAAAPVLFAPAAEPAPVPAADPKTRVLRPAHVLGGAGVVALAIVAVVATIVALRPHRAPRVAELPIESPTVATATAPAPTVTAPPAETVTSAPTASAAPPPRARRVVATRPTATPAPTVTAVPVPTVARPALKCCAGESELACQMRVSAGASCS